MREEHKENAPVGEAEEPAVRAGRTEGRGTAQRTGSAMGALWKPVVRKAGRIIAFLAAAIAVFYLIVLITAWI